MTDTRQYLIEYMADIQRGNLGGDSPRWGWFTTLELEDATVDADTVTFIWRDPADGTRHGWRWRIPPGREEDMDWRWLEELDTSEPTDPDEHGIRWWGVHQWVDGELILNKGA